MIVFKRYLIVITIIILFCSVKLRIDSCEILDKVKLAKFRTFSSNVKLGFEFNKSIHLSQNEYEQLFETEVVKTDTCYLFGKFTINKDRIGIYSYITTYECDHRIGLIEFSILEKCKIIDSKTISFEDNHGFIYNISSKFNKNFNQLTIIEKSGSEYGGEPEAKIDTLFTKTFTIDLKSKKLDTIYKKTKFKLFKIHAQK